MSCTTSAGVTVTIRLLPESATTSSEPATSMSLGWRPATGIDFAVPSGSEGEKWTTLLLAATHIWFSGPKTIGVFEVMSVIVNTCLVPSGSDGRKEPALFVSVIHILPSGPAVIPAGCSRSWSLNLSIVPDGEIRMTSNSLSLTPIHMLPSGPAAILLLLPSNSGAVKWPSTTGAA